MLNIKELWRNPLTKKEKKANKELFLLLKVGTEANKKKKRSPVNIAFVIDRSTSMLDSMDKNSQKRLYEQLIKELNEKQNESKKIAQDKPDKQWGYPGTGTPFGPYYDNGTGNAPDSIQRMGNIISGHDKSKAMDVLQNMVNIPQTNYLNKLDMVKEATISAIELLDENDKVSIIAFGSNVSILCKGELVKNKEKLIGYVKSISCEGMTNLFDGWWQGAHCVAESMEVGYLNRVVLLTDGQANMGKRDINEIALEIEKISAAGISTTSFGVGSDYNEDLLQKIAEKGEGNYYYIKGNNDFSELFIEEFNDINNIYAKKAKIKIITDIEYEILNSAEKESKEYSFNNIIYNKDKSVLIKIKLSENNEKVIRINLSYEKEGVIHSIEKDITIPIVSKKDFYTNQEVVDQIALLKIANEKREAIKALDKGDIKLAKSMLLNATAGMSGVSEKLMAESHASLSNLQSQLDAGDLKGLRKMAKYESYNTSNSKYK